MEANNNSIRDYNKEPTKIGGVQRKVLHVEEDKSDREAAVAHCPQIWKPQKSSAQVSMRKAARRDTQCTTVGPGNTHAYRQLGSELKLTAEHKTINPTNNHLEGWHNRMTKRARKHHLGFYQFLKLIIHEQGKTETVVQQMDDDYTRERGFVRCSAAYRVPQ
ncbi:hypothetical protein T06_4280 [Trichinella sp. T6]|nr:hypothetical protein T06_4280 [Trichinella sp. T6]